MNRSRKAGRKSKALPVAAKRQKPNTAATATRTVTDQRQSCVVTTLCGLGKSNPATDGYGGSAAFDYPLRLACSTDGGSLLILEEAHSDRSIVRRFTLPTEQAKSNLCGLIAGALAATNFQISPLITLIAGYAVNDGMRCVRVFETVSG